MKKQRKNNTEKMKNQKISWLAKAVYAAAAILAVAEAAQENAGGYVLDIYIHNRVSWRIIGFVHSLCVADYSNDSQLFPETQ